jgi:hypothetical protein
LHIAVGSYNKSAELHAAMMGLAGVMSSSDESFRSLVARVDQFMPSLGSHAHRPAQLGATAAELFD